MEENRFFRIVWRVNGIGILLLLVIVAGFSAYNLIKEMFRGTVPAVIINVADDPRGQEKWTLGMPKEIEGTNFVYIPLESERKNLAVLEPAMQKDLHSYIAYFTPSRNLLFVNKQTRDMRWLFNDNTQFITRIDMLSAPVRRGEDRRIDIILYLVVEKDTNGDGKLNSDDLADLAISLHDGSGYKEVLPSVERIFGAMVLDGREALVLYQSDGIGYACTIRLKDLSVVETKEMPRVE